MAHRLEDIDPIGEDVVLDEVLPPGCHVVKTIRSGKSLWVETIRIDVELPDGSQQSFFKKVSAPGEACRPAIHAVMKGGSGDLGLAMMMSAFESEKALRSFIPEHVPLPVAYGTYTSRPDVHFFLSEFVEMDDVQPHPRAWATAVSALHKRSMGKSPGGKFGFHINTHLANIPQNNTWNTSWERFWTQRFVSMCEIEEGRRGPDAELTQVKRAFVDLAIPRYLRPLESEGWSIQPCLLHLDLWPGNAKPKKDSPDDLCLFDSAATWGHNEADLAVTRANLWNLEKAGDIYREIMGVSEPQDEQLIRMEVYPMFGMMLRSAMYVEEPKRRTMAIEAMQSLVNRVLLAPTIRSLTTGEAVVTDSSLTGVSRDAEQLDLSGSEQC